MYAKMNRNQRRAAKKCQQQFEALAREHQAATTHWSKTRTYRCSVCTVEHVRVWDYAIASDGTVLEMRSLYGDGALHVQQFWGDAKRHDFHHGNGCGCPKGLLSGWCASGMPERAFLPSFEEFGADADMETGAAS